ncbi:MAG: glycosyltransferase, partial [Sphingomonas sp.]
MESSGLPEGDVELKHRQFAVTEALATAAPDVTIVLPCLNEVQSLPHCIGNALEALVRLRVELGLSGEIVIADNGSSDGSQKLASELGARLVPITSRGYG